MQTPLRVLNVLRPRLQAAILVATSVSTVIFSATAFLITPVADELHVSKGIAGLMSTAQLAGFVIATWSAGRVLRPRRRVLVSACIGGAVANLVAAVTPWFALLLASRAVSGVALGLIAWLAWAEVFGDDERVGDVAVIGPIVGTVASPIIAAVLDVSGPRWLFAGFGLLCLTPLAFARSMRLEAAKRPHQPRHRPTRGAVLVLCCLALLTLGGSSVFVFLATIGHDRVELSTLTVSMAFSLNAIAGVPSARFRGTRRWSGPWMVLTATAALAVCWISHPLVYFGSMALWGFAFWMGVPGAFSLLAQRSKYPEERAGDAQAVMAVGRVIGPLMGGLIFDAFGSRALGLVGAVVMAAGSLGLFALEFRVHRFALTPP